MQNLDFLHISIADQQLYGFAKGQLVLRMPVSTALNGAGETSGSNCTPEDCTRSVRELATACPWGLFCVGGAGPVRSGTPNCTNDFPEGTGYSPASSG